METPPWERESTGLWIDVPKPTLDLMRAYGIHPAEAIHAAEHAFLNRFALASDIGTECKPAEKEYKSTPTQRKRPARYVVLRSCIRPLILKTVQFDILRSVRTDGRHCRQGI